MNHIVGFVHINKNATTGKGAISLNEFIGQTCAVIEFGVDDCVLVLNLQGSAAANTLTMSNYICMAVRNSLKKVVL